MEIGERFDVATTDVEGWKITNHKREINNRLFLFIAVKQGDEPAYITASEIVTQDRKKVQFGGA